MNNLVKIRRKYIIEIRDKMVDEWYKVFKREYYNIYEDDYIAAECKQLIRECFNKIVNTEWESDIEFLLRYQAEAFYRVGQICVIEKDYDTGCKYLLKATDLMEKMSFQYIIPKYYLRTYMNLAIAYTEKHDKQKATECYKKAETVFGWLEDQKDVPIIERFNDKDDDSWIIYPCNCDSIDRLKVELYLNKAITQMDVYGLGIDRCKINEINEMKECFDNAEKLLEELAEKNTSKNWKEWLKKQEDTLWSTKGTYYKYIYYSSRKESDCLRALDCFVSGLIKDPTNTICMGSIAELLIELKKIDSQNIATVLDKSEKGINAILESNNTVIVAKTIESHRDFLWSNIFKQEKNNMFALNLKTMIEESEMSNHICNLASDYSYHNLRQAGLKRRFEKMDKCIGNNERTTDVLQKLKMDIIKLHTAVSAFMSKSIITEKNMNIKDLEVGHYTRYSVLPLLINQEGNSRIRIRNVKHLNDPTEGRLFVDYIGTIPDNKDALSDEDSDEDRNGASIDLFKDIKEEYDNNNHKSSVYMGCFSSRTDQLNMWSRYGEQGKGCCIRINVKESFDQNASVSFSSMSGEDGEYRYEMEDKTYPLYMVTYLPGNCKTDLGTAQMYAEERAESEKNRYSRLKSIFDSNPIVGQSAKELRRCEEEQKWWNMQAELIGEFIQLRGKLNFILNEIQNDYDTISDKFNKDSLKKELLNTIMIIMDLVRFLVKDDSYKDEREYRIIQYSHTPKCEESVDGIPKLYIDIDRDLKYTSVCFGPLNNSFASDAAYIINLRKKVMDKPDGESWGIEVCQSDIPYR